MDWKTAGALGFGAVIGWYLYFINRYRTADVQIGDITTVIGAIGGAAVLAIFDRGTETFGAYGVGLAAGFFGYFLSLVVLVGYSRSFTAEWFLDGRRPNPPQDWGFGTEARSGAHAMFAPEPPPPLRNAASGTQNFYFAAPVPPVSPASPMPSQGQASEIVGAAQSATGRNAS